MSLNSITYFYNKDKEDKMVNVNIEIDDKTHKRAKKKAIDLNMNLYDYIVEAIKEKNGKTNKSNL